MARSRCSKASSSWPLCQNIVPIEWWAMAMSDLSSKASASLRLSLSTSSDLWNSPILMWAKPWAESILAFSMVSPPSRSSRPLPHSSMFLWNSPFFSYMMASFLCMSALFLLFGCLSMAFRYSSMPVCRSPARA
jgi:hypothetical protein